MFKQHIIEDMASLPILAAVAPWLPYLLVLIKQL
jgi:hypothetical protein